MIIIYSNAHVPFPDSSFADHPPFPLSDIPMENFSNDRVEFSPNGCNYNNFSSISSKHLPNIYPIPISTTIPR